MIHNKKKCFLPHALWSEGGKPESRVMTEEGTLEKECGACTRLQLLTSFIGACLQATFEIHVWGEAVLKLKRRLKWPSSQVVLRMPCWRAMPLKSSFASVAVLVSHSETCSGNRIPLLFYCAHERNRREVGVFWSFKTSSQALYCLSKTLWSFLLIHVWVALCAVH